MNSSTNRTRTPKNNGDSFSLSWRQCKLCVITLPLGDDSCTYRWIKSCYNKRRRGHFSRSESRIMGRYLILSILLHFLAQLLSDTGTARLQILQIKSPSVCWPKTISNTDSLWKHKKWMKFSVHSMNYWIKTKNWEKNTKCVVAPIFCVPYSKKRAAAPSNCYYSPGGWLVRSLTRPSLGDGVVIIFKLSAAVVWEKR